MKGEFKTTQVSRKTSGLKAEELSYGIYLDREGEPYHPARVTLQVEELP